MITSRSNPLIKQVQALRQRKARNESSLFLVEGIRPVGEAVEAGWEIESILYSPEVLKSNYAGELISRVTSNLQPVASQIMDYLTDKENPQGILAVVHQKTSRLEDQTSIQKGVAIVSPQDPGNVGAILRTMDAVSADVLFLLNGGVDPFHPTSVRASMGTIFWIPIIKTSFVELVKWSQKLRKRIIGTSAHAESNYRKIRSDPPWILLLGSEQKGLTEEHTKSCDEIVSLPMSGHASSLNLAVAAGIFLYQLIDGKNYSD